MEINYCQCGKNKPIRTKGLCNACYEKQRLHNKNPNMPYKSKLSMTVSNGYLVCNIGGLKRISRLIMEEAIGRKLLKNEVVHHIDGNGLNNSIGNLMVFPNNGIHTAYHNRLLAFKACGHYDWRKCKFCHEYDDPNNDMFITKDGRSAYHRKCKRSYDKNCYSKCRQELGGRLEVVR